MNILLDTHILLWFLTDDDKLPLHIKETIQDPNNTVYTSIVSFWEISIKLSLEKLKLDITFEKLYDESFNIGFHILHIQKHHLSILKELPFLHRDPFDRLLISQANSDNLTLITADINNHKYDVDVLWK